MQPVATLGLYAGALALVFGAAVGVGNAVGPVGTAATGSASHSSAAAPGDAHGGSEHGDAAPAPGQDLAAGGLAVAQDGYALRLDSPTQAPGTPGRLSFAVNGRDGEPLTDYVREHDKDLHLIVVRRDLTGYQHLHPTRDARGTWTVPLTLAEPGPYKIFADFTPQGRDKPLALAADLTAPGTYTPRPLPAPARTATVDGYDVALDGDLVAGTSSKLTLTVTRNGQPVTDLQPYLGAYGHLVALRDGDLAYLHVHPDGDADDPATDPGPAITFYADVPSPAAYRLFLDFQHDGVVRTAELTAAAARAGGADASADAAAATPTPAAATPPSHGDDPHGH
jgi:hypothetical protein